MNLINTYIFREWSKAFFLVLGATLGIVLLEDMYDELPELLRNVQSWQEIVRYYGILTPSLLPTILPITLLVSLLFTLGQLHRNHEIVVMKACGLSLLRITCSLWIAGGLLAAIMFLLNASLVPWSHEESKRYKQQIKFANDLKNLEVKEVGKLYGLTYQHKEGKRLWFMNNYSEYTKRGRGVNVYQRDEWGREVLRIVAREAGFDVDAGEWCFYEGREIRFDGDSGEMVGSYGFDLKAYAHFDEDPSEMVLLSKRPRDLSLRELKRVKKEAGKTHTMYYHRILASPFSCLIIVGLAIPLVTGGVRINPITGIAKVMVLFFAYYIISNSASLLGSQEIIAGWLAAWIPNSVMAGVAGVLFFRRR